MQVWPHPNGWVYASEAVCQARKGRGKKNQEADTSDGRMAVMPYCLDRPTKRTSECCRRTAGSAQTSTQYTRCLSSLFEGPESHWPRGYTDPLTLENWWHLGVGTWLLSWGLIHKRLSALDIQYGTSCRHSCGDARSSDDLEVWEFSGCGQIRIRKKNNPFPWVFILRKDLKHVQPSWSRYRVAAYSTIPWFFLAAWVEANSGYNLWAGHLEPRELKWAESWFISRKKSNKIK